MTKSIIYLFFTANPKDISYTDFTMTSVLSPITLLNTPPAVDSSKSSSSGSLSDLTSSFSEILSASLLTGSQSTFGGNSSGDSTSVLLPLMLSLIERLMEQQLKAEQAATSAASSTPTAAEGAAVAASTASAGASAARASASGAPVVPGEAPSGRPVGGPVTNTFHPGHNGIDFGIPVGTEIKATMSGKVVYAGWNSQGYGNLVIVENGPYRTYFAHLSRIPVKIGDTVASGSVVGISGNTGNSTGPHLHYEVRKNQYVIDPSSFTLK